MKNKQARKQKAYFTTESKTPYEKKIILTGNVTTTYIEHYNTNTGTSVLIHPRDVEKYYQ